MRRQTPGGGMVAKIDEEVDQRRPFAVIGKTRKFLEHRFSCE